MDAFITRRGGNVKTGKVSDVQAYVMSDPAFVGARNGLVVLTPGSFIKKPFQAKLASVIFIVDGEITGYAYSNSDYEYESSSHKPELDVKTGTITCPDTQYGSEQVMFNGSSVLGEYSYYLWD